MRSLEAVIEAHPFPLPAPLTGYMTLEQMQKEDIVKAAHWRRALLDLPVGYGKTVIATCIGLMLQPQLTMILVPPILIPQWVSWLNSIAGAGLAVGYTGSPAQRKDLPVFDADWLVMSYQVFNNDSAYLRKICAKAEVLTVVDECFPAGTPVLTACGEVPIETLQAGQQVLTSAGLRSIVKVFKALAFQLSTLEMSDGSTITCTPDHPIFTDLGWVRAADCQGRWVLPCAGVSDLRQGVQPQDLRSVGGAEEPDKVRDYLLEILHDEAALFSAPGDVQGVGGQAARGPASGPARAWDTSRAAERRAPKGGVGHFEAAGVAASSEEGQRDWADAGRGGDPRRNAQSRVRVELRGLSGGSGAGVPDELQAGLRTPAVEGGAGGGRAKPQPDSQEGTGSEEGGQIVRVRVVRVSGAKLSTAVPVYNLHVAGRHDYFAGGILVHNCQALKGRGVLFKNVRDFAAGRDLIMMSGTIMSKPGDGYAYVKLNTPDVYASYAQFENIHVKERNFFKQPTEWHNLDLLQANLNLRRVVRSKEEVHSALPKARFIPIYYDLPKEHMALYRRLMEEQLLLLDDGSKIDATTASKLYHAAQQIITNWGVYAGDDTKVSSVFDLVDAVMDEIGLGDAGNSKLILWTIYQRTSASVNAHVNRRLASRKDGSYGVAAYGAVNSKKSIEQFMTDPRAVALTAQPGSAGAGLNPQYLCNECAYIEFPTTTIPFVQSYGRIDRKGQKFNPNIHLFVARDTIQEQLLKNLFDNDRLVQKASGSKQGIKDLIFPG